MSDVGGFGDADGIELTFDDEAAGDLPRTIFGPLPPGSYRPTNYDDDHGPDVFPPPAPNTTGAASLAAFDGTDPNGTWRLFAVDDDDGALTRIDGGWSLDIDWDDSAAPTGSVSVAGGAPTVTTSAGDPPGLGDRSGAGHGSDADALQQRRPDMVAVPAVRRHGAVDAQQG